MSGSRWTVAILATLALVAVALGAVRTGSRGKEVVAASVVDYLSGEPGGAGYARVTGPRELSFPEDEGPHLEYRSEWWYYTGNLESAPEAGRQARPFGFELTFFRNAIAPRAPDRESDWSTNQVYMAHFALSDIERQAFHYSGRIARGAAGLAGARGAPFTLWLDDWTGAVTREDEDVVRLQATEGPVMIDLRVRPLKPPALHGDEGYSRKGPGAVNASYYYSYSRLSAEGLVTTAEGRFAVVGEAWMDHEWSTSALAEDQLGWDWFSIQLEDGRELMLFQIREEAGGIAPESSGSIIDQEAHVMRLTASDFEIEQTGSWESPHSGALYPSGWHLRVPSAELDLRVVPRMRDQELNVSLRYWEGAVSAVGSAGGGPVEGRGYVELTGY